MAKITIDNVVLEVNEGDYILEIARSNGIFIPAICYLSKCSPTLACKLCMVEADGKRVYSCNAKAKEGMNITTNTPEIAKERKAIMQSYVINHPLECGVCDKSGECELQDFTHLMGVDNQEYFVADSPKALDSWGSVKYDPNLCILCERCVTTCKDNVGLANLKMVKMDLNAPDSGYWKERMPKDAFSVWNRKQKGIIGFVGESECEDCAECVSVCPVGALGVKSFQYTTNAWELDKTSSTCALCPSGCKIIYESKKDTSGNRKIYRVTNDFNFNPICGAGRFAWDVDSADSGDSLDLADSAESCECGESMIKATNAIKKASYIAVGGNVTNNEARFLQILSQKFKIPLVNPLLKKYSDFLGVLGCEVESLATLEDISKHKVLFSLGGALRDENPLISYKINNALKMQKDSSLIYAHALKDKAIQKYSKNVAYVGITSNSEDILTLAIANILAPEMLEKNPLKNSKKTIEYKTMGEKTSQVKELVKDENGEEKKVIKEVKEQVEVVENREYYGILENIGLNYESHLSLESTLKKSKPLIIVGSDIYANPNLKFMAKILGNLVRDSKISLLVIPPSANANGICSLLDLESAGSGYSVGFRARGDFRLDCINADFKIPYFHSLNDSITNIDYKILPLNAVFGAKSNYLEKLAKSLGFEFKIPKQNLNNDFGNDGADLRGKKAESKKVAETKEAIEFVESAKSKADFNAYLKDLNAHFYPYTRYSKNLDSKIGIYTSKEYSLELDSLGIKEGDEVQLIIENAGDSVKLANATNAGDTTKDSTKVANAGDSTQIIAKIYVDSNMEDNFLAISPQIEGIKTLFGDVKYLKVQIAKIKG
ncbi:hypothetical protein CCY99_01960 [Helicobacter sp. 16-1353]|uniref:NADH-quinone oxidoreductase subunit G n=1 Tax=Helicobacter sp. 16-1353 TaxID=2004996 RepID=UPI000DCC35E9|nr:NADH-quinone oxidoreductase subunit G [Helicobacter sp. 16-1353]RAX54932.1 hypothetical protein CCY99_01960 [Helicobacter sp. 16-1353]